MTLPLALGGAVAFASGAVTLLGHASGTAPLLLSVCVPAIVAAGVGALAARRAKAEPISPADDAAPNRADHSLQQAFEACAAKLMVCDPEGRVIHVNAALLGFFSEAQDDFRSAFPGCSARDMLERVMLGVVGSERADATTHEVLLGRRRVVLRVAVTRDVAGAATGSVVEWQDATRAAGVAEQARALAAAVDAGDFSGMLAVPEGPATLRTLAECVNAICGEADNRLRAFSAGVDALARELAPDADMGSEAQGDLMERLRASVLGLRHQIADMAPTVDALAELSLHSAGGTAELGQGIGEALLAINRLAEDVRLSASRSGEVGGLAEGAIAVAGTGREIVTGAVEAIGQIEESSARMSEIVGVIDQIAFQTNLLALNAAVEAGRAGDAGRGFAVVASEVRALSQRSAAAAKDIKALIAASNGQVGEGVRLVRDAGLALDRIVSATRHVAETAAAVTQGTTSQASEIERLSRAVAQMDEAAGRNAELAARGEELAQALALALMQISPGVSPTHSERRTRQPGQITTVRATSQPAGHHDMRRSRIAGAGRPA